MRTWRIEGFSRRGGRRVGAASRRAGKSQAARGEVMVLSKRGERKAGSTPRRDAPSATDRKTVAGTAPVVQNGRRLERSGARLDWTNRATAQRAARAQPRDRRADRPGSGLRATTESELGDVFVSMGFIDEHDLDRPARSSTGWIVADLRQTTPEPEALALIPDSMAREHFVIPMKLDEVGLHVAMADQPSPELLTLLARDEWERRSARCWRPSPRSVVPSTTTTEPSAASIISSRHSRPSRPPGGDPSRHDGHRTPMSLTTTHPSSRWSAASSPRPCATGRPTSTSSRPRAGIRVRYRIDGALKEVLTLPSSMGVGLISRIKIMAGMNIVERRRPQDGQLRTEIDGREVDVRVATVATIWGEKCVMRLLDRTRSVLRLGELGMPAGLGRDLLRLRPRPVRHGAVCRSDRERQDDHALRDADRDQRPDPQRHDDRGPGRVRLSRHQPDPDERAGRADLRHRPSLHLAPGPRRHPRRGDPRRGDRPHRRPVRSHGPPRALVAARHGRRVRPAPLPRHGDRILPRGLLGDRDRRPAPRSTDLPDLQGVLHPHRRRAGVLRGERWTREDGLRARRGLQLLQWHRLSGAHRRLRAAAHHA